MITGALAPVSNQTVGLLRDAATTFQAITTSSTDYENTIKESPSTLAVSTDSLRAQQPFLVDFTTFGKYLTPATTQLKAALPSLNPALESGVEHHLSAREACHHLRGQVIGGRAEPAAGDD